MQIGSERVLRLLDSLSNFIVLKLCVKPKAVIHHQRSENVSPSVSVHHKVLASPT